MKFGWVTLYVKNMDQSMDFYNRIVGLEISRRLNPTETMDIVFLGKQETKVELIYDQNHQSFDYGKDFSIGFEVPSLDECIALMKMEKIEIIAGPFQPNPKTKFFYVLDPNGLKVQFYEQS